MVSCPTQPPTDPRDGSPLVTIGEWRSRTAYLYHCHSRDKPEEALILKVVESAEQARRLYQSMLSLAELLPSTGTSMEFAPFPLGWAVGPPRVLMPYLEGISLKTLIVERLAQLQAPASSADPQSLCTEVSRCGEMLGRYHAAHEHTSEGQQCSSLFRGSRDFEKVARSLRVPLKTNVMGKRMT